MELGNTPVHFISVKMHSIKLNHTVLTTKMEDNATIKILSETPLCDTKSVKRASRDTKDPNPLSNTMALMSQKYPITVDLDRAKSSGMPSELYLNVEDRHIAGRVLCKMMAVD